MTLTLSTWGHACVRIERDGRRLVLDPGAFSDPAALDGADAVLITHAHPDHVDPAALAAVLLRWDARQARDADMNRDDIPDINRDVIGG